MYKKYFPKEIHIFQSGLTVCSSQFKGVDGTVGVLGAPHPEFTKAARRHFKGTHAINRFAYYLTPLDLYKEAFELDCEVSLLGSTIWSV